MKHKTHKHFLVSLQRKLLCPGFRAKGVPQAVTKSASSVLEIIITSHSNSILCLPGFNSEWLN